MSSELAKTISTTAIWAPWTLKDQSAQRGFEVVQTLQRADQHG
jgi:hypothetical protein